MVLAVWPGWCFVTEVTGESGRAAQQPGAAVVILGCGGRGQGLLTVAGSGMLTGGVTGMRAGLGALCTSDWSCRPGNDSESD